MRQCGRAHDTAVDAILEHLKEKLSGAGGEELFATDKRALMQARPRRARSPHRRRAAQCR